MSWHAYEHTYEEPHMKNMNVCFYEGAANWVYLGQIGRSEWAMIKSSPVGYIGPPHVFLTDSNPHDQTPNHPCQGRSTASTLFVQALLGRGPNNEVRMPSPGTLKENQSRKHNSGRSYPRYVHGKPCTSAYKYPPHFESSHDRNGTRNPQPGDAQGKSV